MKDAFERRRHVPQRFIGRISTDPDDPGYQNWVNLYCSGSPYKIEVRLNGIVQDNCKSTDVEEGCIERLKCFKGQPVEVDGHFVWEKVTGEVEVRLIKDGSP